MPLTKDEFKTVTLESEIALMKVPILSIPEFKFVKLLWEFLKELKLSLITLGNQESES